MYQLTRLEKETLLQHPFVPECYAFRINANRRVLAVVSYALERLDERTSLNEFAASVFMEKSAFARYFKKKVGITCGNVVRLLKVARASTLLGETDLPIGEIARGLGFRNAGTFIRSFKIVTGVTPSGFRCAELAKQEIDSLHGGRDVVYAIGS